MILRRVNKVENIKDATSPNWGGETPKAIAMNFVPSPGLMDMINCTKCDLDLPRGFQMADPYQTPSPKRGVHNPYNTAWH
jgi:hypothetical protein